MNEQWNISKIREQNRYRVLKQLTLTKTALRSELAQVCGVSTMTIKKVVDDLLCKGLVEEIKVGSDMGRKPQALAFAGGMGCIACCGLSSKQHIEAAVYDVYGNCLFKQRCPVGADYMQSLHGALAGLKQRCGETGLCCIGAAMALPSVYYAQQDRVNNDLIGDFSTLHPRQLLEGYFGSVPLCIMQDVRAAAAAVYEELQEESLFYFYLGDGVGGCYICDGEIATGAASVAGEIGQCLVAGENGPCTLEEVVSVAGLQARLAALGPAKSQAGMEALYHADLQAARCIEQAAQTAAAALYNLNWVLDPHCFVVESTDDFYAQLVASAAERAALATKAPIDNPLRVTCALQGQNHALKGIFEQTREAWLQQAARTANLNENGGIPHAD